MKIGIDVGGTNTDVVLMDRDGTILTETKQLTTDDILTGIGLAVSQLISQIKIDPKNVKAIFIGTTQVLNSLYSGKDLAKTALIRITRQDTLLKPAVTWPSSLKSYLTDVVQIRSKNAFQKRDTFALQQNFEKLDPLYKKIKLGKVESVCIIGNYSPLFEEEEVALKSELRRLFPSLPITLSHKLGSIGFIDRENTALLNAILAKVIKNVLKGLSNIFSELSLECPYWLVQNNGSLMPIQEAIDYPILTIGSGLTNSMKGAAVLSGLSDLIVVDVGGSTIDIGRISQVTPEESMLSSRLMGIDIGIPMPNIVSLPFGGGSVVEDRGMSHQIGKTIAGNIKKDALSWGGNLWTVTDSFLKLFPESFFDEDLSLSALEILDKEDNKKVVQLVMKQVKNVIEQFQDKLQELPIVIVGGGSPLFNKKLFGKYRQVSNPSGYSICSAIGACFSPVTAELDKVYWLNNESKEEVCQKAISTVKRLVIEKGAKESSVFVSSIKEYPFAYQKGEVLRIRVKAIGELRL